MADSAVPGSESSNVADAVHAVRDFTETLGAVLYSLNSRAPLVSLINVGQHWLDHSHYRISLQILHRRL